MKTNSETSLDLDWRVIMSLTSEYKAAVKIIPGTATMMPYTSDTARATVFTEGWVLAYIEANPKLKNYQTLHNMGIKI